MIRCLLSPLEAVTAAGIPDADVAGQGGRKTAVSIPLTEDEEAAVEDGHAALDRLARGARTPPTS
ncbi:hypothetical protein [Streptomyces sp. LaBMicrA B280]|uniref:hypothetical protein n=1 Tax=Streptomyces sp. LaBMicrA B280 TaxID=3391001 RepID=UPI003BA5E2EE